tara:strand:- start:144 stop:632 length:489 start_codon:yes stop_codon:yes gene_type:complete
MKSLVLTRYQTKERDGKSSERWGVSMFFPAWESVLDTRLASLTTEQVEKMGITTDAKEMELKGNPVEQAIAMQLNTFFTAKISSEKMAGKSEKEILDYCEKNFLKVIAEAKSQAEKINAAVNNEQEWFTAKAKEMADLFVKGENEKALAVQAEMEARKKPTV